MRYLYILFFALILVFNSFAEKDYKVLVEVTCKDETEKENAQAILERELRNLGDVDVVYDMKENYPNFIVYVIIVSNSYYKSASYTFTYHSYAVDLLTLSASEYGAGAYLISGVITDITNSFQIYKKIVLYFDSAVLRNYRKLKEKNKNRWNFVIKHITKNKKKKSSGKKYKFDKKKGRDI